MTSAGPWRGPQYCDARSRCRIAATAEYRFYRKEDEPPVVGVDAVWDTNATLPHSPAGVFADGTWYVGCTYYNGFLESGFRSVVRIEVSGGARTPTPPASPAGIRLEARASGVVRIHATYDSTVDSLLDDGAATTWAIWYTTNGVDPTGVGAADATQTMTFVFGAIDYLRYDLPGQANGTDVRVLVRSRRDTTDSDNATVYQITADAAGPSASLRVDDWPGRA